MTDTCALSDATGDADDKAFASILNVAMPSSVERRLVSRFDECCRSLPTRAPVTEIPHNGTSRRLIGMGALVASILICAAVASLMLRGSDAWADVVQAVHKHPWIHGKATLPDGRNFEIWVGIPLGIGASKTEQVCHFVDVGLKESYQYLPSEGTLYRLPTTELDTQHLSEMELVLTAFFRGDRELKIPISPTRLVRRQRREVQDDGRMWIEFELEFHDPRMSPTNMTTIYRVDPDTNLPVSMTHVRNTVRIQFSLDYPDTGPADVFALGVPRDAKLVDRIPNGDVQRILAAAKVGRQRIGPYSCVMLESLPPQPGKPLDITGVYRFWRNGNRWRIARVWEEEMTDLRQQVWNKKVTIPSDPDLALAWWKDAAQGFRTLPLFVSDGKAAYRFKHRFFFDKNTGKQDFEVTGAALDYIQLDPTDPMPTTNLLPEQMCFPPMGIPSQRCEVKIEDSPSLGPASTTLVNVTDTTKGQPKRAWRFWIDARHGFASARSEIDMNGQIVVDVIDEFRQSPQGTWYAYRMRRGSVRDAGGELGNRIVAPGEGEPQTTTTSHRWYLVDFDAELPDDLFATPAKIVAGP